MKPTTNKGENLYKNIKMHLINYWFFISQQSQLLPTFKAIFFYWTASLISGKLSNLHGFMQYDLIILHTDG